MVLSRVPIHWDLQMMAEFPGYSNRSPSNSALYFQFINATTGFYSDGSTGIYKTYDAGNHWTWIFNQGQQFYPFYFLDSLTGFLINAGKFYKSIDGGINWVLVSSGVSTSGQGFYKMQFLRYVNRVFGHAPGFVKTTDGGRTWVNCLAASTSFMIPFLFP